ncbi:MAG TPA: hypothetical protein VM683_11500 [Anaeromyxobacteraceae bacterium]|nr:hypothetical protein [Anaeromyxobacteraceae bacterium]
MAIVDVSGGSAAPGRSLVEQEVASAQLRDAGALGLARLDGAAISGVGVAQSRVAGAPAYLAMPASTGYTPAALDFAPAERGYAAGGEKLAASTASTTQAAARKTTTTKAKTTSKASTTKSSSSAKSTKTTPKTASAELAFLDDPRLSIEDKLFQFMALMQQKSDRELTDAMKSYEGKKTAAAKSTSTAGGSTGSTGSTQQKSSGGGGGLFGALGDALGGIAKTVVSGAESLAKDLGGPLLAAGCTAVGLPFLAPVALEIGGPLARSAVSGLASAVGVDELGGGAARTSASKSSASSSTSSTASKSASSATSAAGDEEFDEKLEMMKLQRLVEKQETMFAALSNVLKSLHESQMVAVNNIR